jgi:hypothetical protein
MAWIMGLDRGKTIQLRHTVVVNGKNRLQKYTNTDGEYVGPAHSDNGICFLISRRHYVTLILGVSRHAHGTRKFSNQSLCWTELVRRKVLFSALFCAQLDACAIAGFNWFAEKYYLANPPSISRNFFMTGWSISLSASPIQRTEACPVTAIGSTQTPP